MPVEVGRAPDEFAGWAELLALLTESFAYQEKRIDPPSSVLRLDPVSLAEKAAGEHLILAIDHDRVVGCVFAARRGDALYLSKLAVRPDRQGAGIGRRLMAAVESLASREGHAALELETRIELTENHATFGAMGFVKIDERAHEGYDRATFIVMRKPIA